MESAEVEKLLKGVGIIIDDNAANPKEKEYKMVESLKSAGLPVAVYSDIPNISAIDSFGSISFVILDWDFTKLDETSEVQIGDELKKHTRRTILEFLKELLNRVFAPVFVITGQEFSVVENELKEADIYSTEKPTRIMLKTKEEVNDYSSLVSSVQVWLENMPSAIALKIWEKEAVAAKNKMFLDLYAASPSWVNVLLGVLKKDTNENPKATNHEFSKVLSNNFVNRMCGGSYCSIEEGGDIEVSTDELRKVLQGERFITYDQNSMPEVSYVGDLYRYKEKNKYKYRLNIRAECDVIREDDPLLYLLPGKKLNISKVAKLPRIEMITKGENNFIVLDKQEYSIDELNTYDTEKIVQFNSQMEKFDKLLLFLDGSIIEKKTHSVLSCVAGEYLMEFFFKEFEIMKKSELDTKAERVGRIIPPYITKVQNAFSSFIVREGLMPIPEELFNQS